MKIIKGIMKIFVGYWITLTGLFVLPNLANLIPYKLLIIYLISIMLSSIYFLWTGTEILFRKKNNVLNVKEVAEWMQNNYL